MKNLRWCKNMCGSCRVCLPSRDRVLDGKHASIESLTEIMGCLFYSSVDACFVEGELVVVLVGDATFRLSKSNACALLACSIGAGEDIFKGMLVLIETDLVQFKKVHEYRVKSDHGAVSNQRYMQVRNYALGLCVSCNKIADGTHRMCIEHAKTAIIAARGKKETTDRGKATRRACQKRCELKRRRARRGLLPTDLVPTGRPKGGKNKCSVCGVEGHTAPTHHRHL